MINFVSNGSPCLLSGAYLIVLHGLIPALLACLVRNLHEVPVDERHPDVDVETWVIRGYRDEIDLELLHLSLELRSDVISLQHCTLRDEIVPAPIFIVLICEANES